MEQKTKILIGILIIAIALIGVLIYQYYLASPPAQPKELKLSDFPEVFKENTLIIIGDKASEIEIQAVNEIADYLEKETGNKPLIKKYSEITQEDRKNNLIIVGTPNSNPMLKGVYEMADVLEVNETFPEEGKGVLEILGNPWDEDKAMLLVEGWDEWGVRAGSLIMVEENKKLIEKQKFVDWVEYTGIEFPIDSKEEAIRYAKLDPEAKEFIKHWSAKGYRIKIWAVWDSYYNVWEIGIEHRGITDLLFLLRFKPDGTIIKKGVVPTV